MSGETSSASPPSLPWRTSSSIVMSVTGLLSRGFLLGASYPEAYGLDEFLKILEERKDVKGRTRGLITVSNHVSVVDDPLIWGMLPIRYYFSPTNLRWGLGSHDLIFKSQYVSLSFRLSRSLYNMLKRWRPRTLKTFFTLGQVLPTHRQAYSRHGGLFQPTVSECIRLLSRPLSSHTHSQAEDSVLENPPDPFTNPSNLYYTTTGTDSFVSPSLSHTHRNAHAWIHIFPEGRIHQHPARAPRYFKWGVARLILESEPMPQIVPMWIEGAEEVMHESRGTPRFLPRPGKTVKVVFGREVDGEGVFGSLRREWQYMVEQDRARQSLDDVGAERTSVDPPHVGSELSPRLKYGDDAVRLRIEVTRRVREEVLKLRREMGWPNEDPKGGLADTWRVEGLRDKKDEEGQMDDGSWIKEH